MKRLIPVLAILCLGIYHSQAQNVGIGTSSPSSKVDVSGDLALREGTAITVTSGANTITLPTAKNSVYRLMGASGAFSISSISAGNNGMLLTLINATGQIMTVTNGSIQTNTGADLVGSTSASTVNLLYNTSLSKWLVISGEGFVVSAANIYNSDGTLTGARTVTLAANNLNFNTSGTGKVGIGYASPGAPLEIRTPTAYTTAGYEAILNLGGSSANATAATIYRNYANSQHYVGMESKDPGSTAKRPLVFQEFGGNVGIGTNNPAVITEISAGSTELLKLTSTTGGAGNHAYIDFATFAGTYVDARIGAIDMNSNNGALVFETGNQGTASTVTTERMRILNTGQVGIGTTTPGNMLDVQGGNIDASGYIQAGGTAGGALIFSGGAQNGSAASGGASFFGRPRIGDWGNWLTLGEPNGTNGGEIIQVTGSGVYTGTSSAIATAPTLRNCLDNGSGRVGIGTTNPSAMLHVTGTSVSGSAGTNRFFKYDQGNNVNVGGTYGSVIAYFQGDVLGSAAFISAQTFTFSDRRIKNVIGTSDGTTDLAKLNEIEVTNYKYIDTVTNGNKVTKKVIAQQVQSVYPQAVSVTVGFIPDIYEIGCPLSYNSKSSELTVQLSSLHKLKAGDKIKMYDEKNEEIIADIVAVPSEKTFTIKSDVDHNELFIFGKRVEDFLTVDYDAISMLNVSATQELAKRLKEEQEKNAALQKQLSDMQLQNKDARTDIDKLKASVETLQQIIGAKTQK